MLPAGRRSGGAWSRSVLKTEDPGAAAPPLEDEIRAIQRLLGEGRTAEAEPRLRALAETHPGHPWFWTALAQCHEASGDTSAELEATTRVLALDPSRNRLRMRAALILEGRGDFAEAAAHYRVLADAHPERPKLALRLARTCRWIGDEAGETAALAHLLALEPANVEAHGRLADLHETAGRMGEAATHLNTLAHALPDRKALWGRLARALEASGDLAGAEAAWAHVLGLDPDNLEAGERLTVLRASGSSPPPGRAPAAGLKLAVLGNCQAYAMARCLRVLNPAARISAVGWAELRTPAQIERMHASLGEFDAVLAQPVNVPRLERLGPKVLIRRARCFFFPGINFTGFQPDAVRAFGDGVRSLIGEWHSALVMAAWRMGLPEARAEELFNAYIYGALGYFDEYAKAEQFLHAGAARIGWDLSAELEAWPAPFVHTPNHPRIEVMMDLARAACALLGLEAEADVAPPADPFAVFGAWPIYPEIGRRLGLKGEMSFVSPTEGGRALALDEAIAWYYAVYAKAPPEALAAVDRVDEVIAMLKAEGV